jgi:ATP-binding cassette subfamily A (ABC1) protein 3
MGRGWSKFVLLTWKNWTLQRRHPIQTAVEILAPVLLASLLVLIRSLVEPEKIDHETSFTPFSPEETNGTLFSSNRTPYQLMTTLRESFVPPP